VPAVQRTGPSGGPPCRTALSSRLRSSTSSRASSRHAHASSVASSRSRRSRERGARSASRARRLVEPAGRRTVHRGALVDAREQQHLVHEAGGAIAALDDVRQRTSRAVESMPSRATSAWARIAAIGVRSSCAACEVKRRSACMDARCARTGLQPVHQRGHLHRYPAIGQRTKVPRARGSPRGRGARAAVRGADDQPHQHASSGTPNSRRQSAQGVVASRRSGARGPRPPAEYLALDVPAAEHRQ